MLWVIYNILFTVGYFLMLPNFLMRMWRRGGYRKGFLQRVAYYEEPLRRKIRERRRVWVHAVSVGEVYVALRYMREMREQRPGTAFVLSTTTSTGHRVAGNRLSAADALIYYPSDFPFAVKRALQTINPLCLILTESEIWPNMIRTAKRRNVPVMIINGRISQSSYKGYRLLRMFFSRVISLVDLIFVQTEGDRRRLLDVGGISDRIRVAGSSKYDVAQAGDAAKVGARELLAPLGWSESLLLLGGSTWAGEENALLEIYARLKKRFNSLRLILVPRHAERSDEVEARIRACEMSMIRRSRFGSPGGHAAEAVDVLLVDTTGELMSFYACADVIFVGKSLSSRGGQNIIEPAVFGKPVIVGPHMDNFPDVMSDFLAADAIVQVADAAELELAVERLLGDDEERKAIGERARAVVERKRGVVRECAERILERL